MSNLGLARHILNQFIRDGLLGSDSSVRDGRFSNRPEVVEITSIRATKPKQGYATAFLKALRSNGIKYDINWPKKQSVGFWRKMHERGLLPNPVESYSVFEKKFPDYA